MFGKENFQFKILKTMDMKVQLHLAVLNQMDMDYTICVEMFGSGFRTFLPRDITHLQQSELKIQKDLHKEKIECKEEALFCVMNHIAIDIELVVDHKTHQIAPQATWALDVQRMM